VRVQEDLQKLATAIQAAQQIRVAILGREEEGEGAEDYDLTYSKSRAHTHTTLDLLLSQVQLWLWMCVKVLQPLSPLNRAKSRKIGLFQTFEV